MQGNIEPFVPMMPDHFTIESQPNTEAAMNPAPTAQTILNPLAPENPGPPGGGERTREHPLTELYYAVQAARGVATPAGASSTGRAAFCWW